MRIGVNQPVEIIISPRETAEALRERVKNVMEVAAIKALEAAVERTPASGETPYATGQLRQSIRVQRVSDMEFELYVPMHYAYYFWSLEQDREVRRQVKSQSSRTTQISRITLEKY